MNCPVGRYLVWMHADYCASCSKDGCSFRAKTDGIMKEHKRKAHQPEVVINGISIPRDSGSFFHCPADGCIKADERPRELQRHFRENHAPTPAPTPEHSPKRRRISVEVVISSPLHTRSARRVASPPVAEECHSDSNSESDYAPTRHKVPPAKPGSVLRCIGTVSSE